MIFTVRTDASDIIGFGHLYRSIAFSLKIKKSNDQIYLVSKELPSYLKNWLKNLEVEFFIIPQHIRVGSLEDLYFTKQIIKDLGKIDLLIVDSYSIDQKWESKIKSFVNKILVIDDLANRKHNCDFLIDQNLRFNVNRYSGLVSNKTKVFLGPKYAFLRDEFYSKKPFNRIRKEVNNILIFMGGGDNNYEIKKILKVINIIKFKSLNWTLIIGKNNRELNQIIKISRNIKNLKLIEHIEEISNLIFEADLAIGTCGISAWERCLSGLPTLVFITAENQKEDAIILDKLNAVKNLGYAENISVESIVIQIKEIISNKRILEKMSFASTNILQGHKEIISEFFYNIRQSLN